MKKEVDLLAVFVHPLWILDKDEAMPLFNNGIKEDPISSGLWTGMIYAPTLLARITREVI